MAKVVTENFRVETTNEFYRSFFNRNDDVVDNFENELSVYSAANELDLSNTNISEIASLIRDDLETLVPENNYYIFASNINGTTEIQNTQKDKREFQRRVIFGNKITENDIYYMFDRNPWVEGTIYDSFDDTIDVRDQNLYVNVLDGNINEASYKIFKCIRNNGGGPSTVKPSTSNLNPKFETTLSDGYVWKYMFEVPAADYLVYSTTQSLPYVPDQNVIDVAEESVSEIIIERTRTGLFSAFDLGTTTVQAVTVEDAADNTYRIELSVENEPKSSDGSYINMYLRVSQSGAIYDIINSTIPTNPDIELSDNRVLILFVRSDANLVSTLPAGSSCKVVPKIKVSRSLGEDCVAYGVINTAGTLVEILFANKGTQYKYATARLMLPSAVNEYSAETELRVILSSRGGHGSDPISELRMSKLAVVSNFISNSLTNIPDSNTYTQVGLIKNPTFRDGTFPKDMDNRMKVVVSGSILSDIVATGSYIFQDKPDLDETVSGIIHEISYDADADETTIYLVDYTGDFESDFTAGSAYAKVNADDVDSDILTINTVTKGNYVPFSGELLHFVNFDAITRDPIRKEKVKFVFDF